MIPQQTLVNYPVFGDNASKVQPGGAKYSAGFQQADVYPAEWVNWAWNKNSAGITALNAGVASLETEVISVLTEAGKTPDAEAGNQLLQSIQKLITDAETRAKLAAHPIGSLYWSANSTDPGTLFGGTWQRIKDTFIWAAGDSDTVNATGGAKTVTLEVSNLPSHNHSVGAHKHGLNSHTHGYAHTHEYTPAGKIASTSGGTDNKTAGMSANATGTYVPYGTKIPSVNYYSGNITSATHTGQIEGSYGGGSDKCGGFTIDVSHTHTAYFTGTKKSTTSQSATTTDGATGNTANSSAFDSGSTGSGTAVDKMPPYTVKYCWQRVS